jgi:hypothetical protein
MLEVGEEGVDVGHDDVGTVFDEDEEKEKRRWRSRTEKRRRKDLVDEGAGEGDLRVGESAPQSPSCRSCCSSGGVGVSRWGEWMKCGEGDADGEFVGEIGENSGLEVKGSVLEVLFGDWNNWESTVAPPRERVRLRTRGIGKERSSSRWDGVGSFVNERVLAFEGQISFAEVSRLVTFPMFLIDLKALEARDLKVLDLFIVEAATPPVSAMASDFLILTTSTTTESLSVSVDEMFG